MRSYFSLIAIGMFGLSSGNTVSQIDMEPVGVWDGKDFSRAEAYYDDEDFFTEKDGKMPFLPGSEHDLPSTKTFFLESHVIVKDDNPNVKSSNKIPSTWKEAQYESNKPIKKLRRAHELMRFREKIRLQGGTSNTGTAAAKQKLATTSAEKSSSQAKASSGEQLAGKMIPGLPVAGIVSNNPGVGLGVPGLVSPPPCSSFSNTPEGHALLAQYNAQYPEYYKNQPCAIPTATLTGSLLPEAPMPHYRGTMATEPHSPTYYSDPIQNMMPQYQIPNVLSPPINFYSDGERYPRDFHHFDLFQGHSGSQAAEQGGSK